MIHKSAYTKPKSKVNTKIQDTRFVKMNKTLFGTVKLKTSGPSWIQKLTDKGHPRNPKIKSKQNNFFRAKPYPEVSLLLPAVSVTSVWNPASPKAAYKSSVNNCCCALHRRYFSSQVSQKSTINVIIYLAIHPNHAFTEVRKIWQASNKTNQKTLWILWTGKWQSMHLKGSCNTNWTGLICV